MNITIEHHDKTFNINFHRAEGEEAFLSIKGCRIAQGPKGDFLALPSRKKQRGDGYWKHAWADEKFQSAVMQMAAKATPVKAPPKPAPKLPDASGFDSMDSDVPYMDPLKRRGYHLAI